MYQLRQYFAGHEILCSRAYADGNVGGAPDVLAKKRTSAVEPS